MKLIKLLIIIAMLTSTAHAEYEVKLPLDIPINFVYKDSKLVTEYGNWINVGIPFECSSWSPLENTITINQAFNQNSSCVQKQVRSVQQYMQSLASGEKVPYGKAIQEEKNISTTQTKESIGSLETWMKLNEKLVVSDWVNSGTVYDCTNWIPATTTIDWKESFTQTTNECKQKQTRIVQDQEQETTTLAIRTVGSQITETQDIAGSGNMLAYGTRASIMNNPLTRVNSHSGVISNGSVSTKGMEGTLMFGPYVKDLPLGIYELKLFGSTGYTEGAVFDIVNSGGLYSYFVAPLPSNTNGLIAHVTVNIDTLDQNYGIEVRVRSKSTTSAIITGYELIKIN